MMILLNVCPIFYYSFLANMEIYIDALQYVSVYVRL